MAAGPYVPWSVMVVIIRAICYGHSRQLFVRATFVDKPDILRLKPFNIFVEEVQIIPQNHCRKFQSRNLFYDIIILFKFKFIYFLEFSFVGRRNKFDRVQLAKKWWRHYVTCISAYTVMSRLSETFLTIKHPHIKHHRKHPAGGVHPNLQK